MRFVASLALSMIVLSGVAAADEPPRRVVSTSLCADQMALLLLPRDRIASLSWVGSDPHVSNLWREAEGIPQNSSRAEEVVVLKPDFVVAEIYSSALASRFAKMAGTPVHLVNSASSIDDVRTIIRDAAKAMHVAAKGEEIVRGMDARLAAIPRGGPDVTALVYEPNGLASAAGTLTDDVLRAAGLRNSATALLDESYGVVALETIVAHPPDILVIDDAYEDSSSRAQNLLNHPALRALKGRSHIMSINSRLWLCPGPWIAAAVERLAAEKSRVLESRAAPLARPQAPE